MWYGYENDKCFERVPKMCFCIGPEKCGDTSCPQVQAYKRRKQCFERIILDNVSHDKNKKKESLKKMLERIAQEMKYE